MNQYDPIRKKLKDFQVPIDKDMLWANTSHAIPKKRRKRGVFFLLLAGVLLLSSGMIFYTLSNSENSINSNTKIQSANQPSSGNPSYGSNNTTDQTTTGSTLSISSEPESIHEVASNEKSVSQKLNHQTSTAQSTKHSSQSNKTKSLVTSQNTSLVDGSVKSENQPGPSFGSEERETASSSDPEIAVTDRSSHQIPVAISIDHINTESNPETRIANYITKDIPSLLVYELSILPREISTSNVVSSRAKNKNLINLLVMQGFGWSTINMVTDDQEIQPTIDTWKNKIKSLENLSSSLYASIRLPKGFQLGAGLQYSKLTTQLEYQQTWSESYTEQGITEIIIDEQGNVQNLMGDVNVYRQSIIHSTRFTSHTRLDVEGILTIPVIRNYRTETGLWVKVGYNILHDAKGTTFGPGDVPVQFSYKDNPFTLQSPFNFGAGIGSIYRLNPHLTLNARVGYERLRYTHGLYDDRISFHHSIFSLGLGAGYTF